MAFSNKACIAPKDLPCGKKGKKFKLNNHFVRKCRGTHCPYLIRLDELPEEYYDSVRQLRGAK